MYVWAIRHKPTGLFQPNDGSGFSFNEPTEWTAHRLRFFYSPLSAIAALTQYCRGPWRHLKLDSYEYRTVPPDGTRKRNKDDFEIVKFQLTEVKP